MTALPSAARRHASPHPRLTLALPSQIMFQLFKSGGGGVGEHDKHHQHNADVPGTRLFDVCDVRAAHSDVTHSVWPKSPPLCSCAHTHTSAGRKKKNRTKQRLRMSRKRTQNKHTKQLPATRITLAGGIVHRFRRSFRSYACDRDIYTNTIRKF